jgi:hypothetical protein
MPMGLNIGTILSDSDLTQSGQLAWWTFQNHLEHYIANGVVLEPTPTVFPFW